MFEKWLQKRRWVDMAEKAVVSDWRSFEDQLGYLLLSPEELKGKTILVLGPGADFDFEKKAAEAGAELVVTLSYTYDLHTSPELVRQENPKVQPIKGLFQELPPADDTFDLITSVYGFPLYASKAYKEDENRNLYRPKDIEGMKKHYSDLISLLSPGGQARLVPVSEQDIQFVREIQKESPERFTFDTIPISGGSQGYDTLLVIRKSEQQTA